MALASQKRPPGHLAGIHCSSNCIHDGLSEPLGRLGSLPVVHFAQHAGKGRARISCHRPFLQAGSAAAKNWAVTRAGQPSALDVIKRFCSILRACIPHRMLDFEKLQATAGYLLLIPARSIGSQLGGADHRIRDCLNLMNSAGVCSATATGFCQIREPQRCGGWSASWCNAALFLKSASLTQPCFKSALNLKLGGAWSL